MGKAPKSAKAGPPAGLGALAQSKAIGVAPVAKAAAVGGDVEMKEDAASSVGTGSTALGSVGTSSTGGAASSSAVPPGPSSVAAAPPKAIGLTPPTGISLPQSRIISFPTLGSGAGSPWGTNSLGGVLAAAAAKAAATPSDAKASGLIGAGTGWLIGNGDAGFKSVSQSAHLRSPCHSV